MAGVVVAAATGAGVGVVIETETEIGYIDVAAHVWLGGKETGIGTENAAVRERNVPGIRVRALVRLMRTLLVATVAHLATLFVMRRALTVPYLMVMVMAAFLMGGGRYH